MRRLVEALTLLSASIVTPHVKAQPTIVGEHLRTGFSSLGWDVATNAPCAGSSPPHVEAVRAFLDAALAAIMPDMAVARMAAAQATVEALKHSENSNVNSLQTLHKGIFS